MWNILSSGRTVRQRECYAFARHSASLQRRSHALTTMSHLGDLGWRQISERINMAARHYQRVPWVRGTNVEKGDHQIGFKHHARRHLTSKDSAKDATGGHVWLSNQAERTRPASAASGSKILLKPLVRHRGLRCTSIQSRILTLEVLWSRAHTSNARVGTERCGRGYRRVQRLS